MRVLLLSNNWEVAEPVRAFLDEQETLRINDKPLIDGTRQSIGGHGEIDIIVSYCYRHMIGPETLKRYPAVNLHNAYLPWGKGAQPLFHCIMSGYPIGVSIHWMDEGLDTGTVIDRMETGICDEMTFADAYKWQHQCLSRMFKECWPEIRAHVEHPYTTKDFEADKWVLGDKGWDCTIGEARGRV